MNRLLGRTKNKFKDDSDLLFASSTAVATTSSSSLASPRLPLENNSSNSNNPSLFDGSPEASSLPVLLFGHPPPPSSSSREKFNHRGIIDGDNNKNSDDDDDDDESDDVTFGYRSALSAYAHTIPPALSNEDGRMMGGGEGTTAVTLRYRKGGAGRRVVASSSRRNGGKLPAVLEQQQHQQHPPPESLSNTRREQGLFNVEEDDDAVVNRGNGEGSLTIGRHNKTAPAEKGCEVIDGTGGGGGDCENDNDMEHRQGSLHPPLHDEHPTLDAFGQVTNLVNDNGTLLLPKASPQNLDFLDWNHSRHHDGRTPMKNKNSTAFTTAHIYDDGSTHPPQRLHHPAMIHPNSTTNLVSPHILDSFRHGSRINRQHQQQQQQPQQYRDDHLSVSPQIPSSGNGDNDDNNNSKNNNNNNDNNDTNLHSNNSHLVLQPGAIYEEHYGDAYVDQNIFYLYPAGYQSMRPRSGPWKLSIFIFLLFLWLSVFTVEHCYDRGKREYNPYFEQADDEYLQDVTDDALVMETRWCGSKVLYCMWMVSIWITVLSMSYCSIIGYVKMRDFVVANGRSQPPGIGGGGDAGGRSDYYVAVKNVGAGRRDAADAGMTAASDDSGSDVTSPSSSAALYPSYQIGNDRNRYSSSIYQSDGTPQFWGGHIYRPTQAAVALTNRN
jgi:hypothetical protein